MLEPLKVLVVDDNLEKTRDVVGVLIGTGLCNASTISDARDATTAKRLIRAQHFDLLVIDIALPLRIDQEPDSKGGLALLSEVLTRDGYKRPGHIVGLTAFEDVFTDAESSFGQYLWSVIHYDRSTTEWQNRLVGRLRHISASIVAKGLDQKFDYDLAVICALDDPELEAIKRLPWSLTPLDDAADATQYYAGVFRTGEVTRRVVAAAAPMMGSAASAALCMKMICRFRPQYIIHAGVLAGTKGEVELGDVVVGNPVWDWGSGKHYKENDTAAFAIAPHQFPLNPRVRGQIERIRALTRELEEVRLAWPGLKPSASLSVRMGPISSGSSVIADAEVASRIKEQHRKLVGIEMEAFGVLAAIDQAPHPQPIGVVVKSVQDFADEKKDDTYRHYAAHTSAAITALLAQRLSYDG